MEIGSTFDHLELSHQLDNNVIRTAVSIEYRITGYRIKRNKLTYIIIHYSIKAGH